jgi:type VI secretion system secreted protein Hcp
MAVDAFLQFTKKGNAQEIKGETQDAYFKNPKEGGPAAFELQTWTFSAANPASIGSATMGAGSGKATFEPFTVTKNIDIASPFLFKTCCAGGHYDELTLWIRKAGQDTKSAGGPYLQWKFAMAFISKLTWTHGDPMPTEEVTFVYGAVQFSYKVQQKTGDMKDGSHYEWSQVLNTKEFAVV